MSQVLDMWMTPGKRRLVRRTVDNGPYGPPEGSEEGGDLGVPAATKLTLTVDGASALTVGQLVMLVPQPGTGSAEAYQATKSLRCVVDAVAGSDVTLSTAPTDLSGIDFTGLVVDVVPV